jgi:hypothetical protein
MAEFLYAPSREQVVTTNAWAFLHWLRTVHGVDLPDWAALQRWSADDHPAFRSAIADFGRLPDKPLRLARHCGAQEAIVLHRVSGRRIALSRTEALAGSCPCPELTVPLARLWPPALLIRPLAELLLHADLRPDDRLLVTGPQWPWLAALLEGTTVILAACPAAALLALAAEEHATVMVAPAQTLAEAAFQRSRRPHLGNLRTIIATSGPLSPEARRRVYTWVKSDVLLLARTGNTLWGNPLDPVLARPPASPAFLTPPLSGPARR